MNHETLVELLANGHVGDTCELTGTEIFSDWLGPEGKAIVTKGNHNTGIWYHVWVDGVAKGAFRTCKEAIDYGMTLVTYTQPETTEPATMQTVTLLVPSLEVARYKAILEENTIRYALTYGADLTELTIQSEEETLVRKLLGLEVRWTNEEPLYIEYRNKADVFGQWERSMVLRHIHGYFSRKEVVARLASNGISPDLCFRLLRLIADGTVKL